MTGFIGITMILAAVVWPFTGDFDRSGFRLRFINWWGFATFVCIGLGLVKYSQWLLKQHPPTEPTE